MGPLSQGEADFLNGLAYFQTHRQRLSDLARLPWCHFGLSCSSRLEGERMALFISGNMTHRGLEKNFTLTFSFTYIYDAGVDPSMKRKGKYGLDKHLHFNFLLIS